MIIATTHKNTDFDGLASVIAATILYPDCIGVVPKMTNKNVTQFLSTHKTAFNLILPNEVNHEKVSKLVVVDTNQWHRLDRLDKLAKRKDLAIDLWDHHTTGEGDIAASWICKEHIGATVTLFVREMQRRQISLTPLDSTIILIGLYEDTGLLSFPSTTPDDARAAAFLLEKGADLNVAGFFLNPPYEESQKEILFEMMKATEKKTINGHSIGFNIIALEQKVNNLAAIVNIYRKIINVDALFVIFTAGDRKTLIGRSGLENIHIGEIMKSFGGGGHAGAGSASVRDKNISADKIKLQLIENLSTRKIETARITDIMSFPVISTSPDTNMRDVQTLMTKEGIRGVIVMQEEEILGIIVLWDLKRIKKESHWKSPVKAFMSRSVITISPEAQPSDAARIMIEKDLGYLPVVKDGELIGIVTRTDILTFFYNLLPD